MARFVVKNGPLYLSGIYMARLVVNTRHQKKSCIMMRLDYELKSY